MKAPITRDSNRKNQLNSSSFNNRTKSIIIINTIALFKSLGHQTCLISINSAIRFSLDFVNPFTINDISSLSSRNKMPCLVGHQGREFLIHSLLPSGIIHSFRQRFRLTSGAKMCISNHTRKQTLWFHDVIMKASRSTR
jgi:hypothetical protein